jgi:4-carboxymuconolactone decarboxylase
VLIVNRYVTIFRRRFRHRLGSSFGCGIGHLCAGRKPGSTVELAKTSRRAASRRYLRHEAGLGGPVRELAILTTARELDSQFEWAAHEPEAVAEGVSQEIIDIIKHRNDTSGLDEVDAIVIELGREIFGARKVTSATFARSLQQFGRRALVDLVALMGNYAGTAALLTAFDMQLDPSQPPPLPQP